MQNSRKRDSFLIEDLEYHHKSWQLKVPSHSSHGFSARQVRWKELFSLPLPISIGRILSWLKIDHKTTT